MKLKKLHIENFCGLKIFDAEFTDKTLISGKNETGKSTIRNAIFYVFTGKLADGSSADGIRPHDQNGIDTDYVDIVAELTLLDGEKEITLKKTEKQKWTKHRGSEAPVYEGNVTEYEICGIPKKLKDYTDFVNSMVDADTLLYGTNAQAFLGLDNKKRRAKLMSLCGDSSIESLADSKEEYNEIKDMFQYGTVDELIARSRKVIKGKNDELKTLPVRIDEVSKQKVEIDGSLLQEKERLSKEIETVKAEIKAQSNEEKITELQGEKMRLSFDMNALASEAQEQLYAKRNSLVKQSNSIDEEIASLSREIENLKADNEGLTKEVESNKTKIDAMKPEYNEIKGSVFDESKWVFNESDTVCSLCGQTLPQAKIDELKNNFEQRKNKAKADFEKEKEVRLSEIKEKGNGLAIRNKEINQKIADNIKVFSEKEIALNELSKNLEAVKTKLNILPSVPNLSQDDNYIGLKTKIGAIDAEIEKLSSGHVDEELDQKLDVTYERLEEINKQLNRIENNKVIDQRIEELAIKQRSLSQEIADEERILNLLERFNKEYVEVLTDTVNSYFDIIKWKMFKQNITNGGYEQVCEPMINGTSYYKTLNHGSRLLAEIDICKAFQNVGGKKMFISLDDAESIDADRIPTLDRQILIFRRTDEDKLTITQL